MKRWLWMILVLSSPLPCAQKPKLEGFIIDPAAFRKIQSYCVDTHNLPPDQVKVIEHFVALESKTKGLLRKLPWSRRQTCQDPGVDAIVRMEFPHDAASAAEDEVKGALLVFRPGLPSPIYETPAVTIQGEPRRHSPDDDNFSVDLVADLLEYNALGMAVRILIHDWQKR